MAIRGRKRKVRVIRDRSGKSRGEPVDVVKAVVWAQRERLIGSEHKDDALAGFTLGRLLLRHRASKDDPSGITEGQRQAGEAWAEIERQHKIVMGYELHPLQGMTFEARSPTTGHGHEYNPEQVAKIRDKWTIGQDAIMAVCRHHGLGVRYIVHAVCVENIPVEHMSEADFGNLKLGLNALERAFK